jgi:hypothetical protein
VCAGCNTVYYKERLNLLSKTKLGSEILLSLQKSLPSKVASPVLILLSPKPLSIPIPGQAGWRIKPESRLAWMQSFVKNEDDNSPNTYRNFFTFGFNTALSVTAPEPLLLEFPGPNSHEKRDFWLLAIREMIAVRTLIHDFNIKGECTNRLIDKSVFGIVRLKAMLFLKTSVFAIQCEKFLSFLSLDSMAERDKIVKTVLSNLLSLNAKKEKLLYRKTMDQQAATADQPCDRETRGMRWRMPRGASCMKPWWKKRCSCIRRKEMRMDLYSEGLL